MDTSLFGTRGRKTKIECGVDRYIVSYYMYTYIYTDVIEWKWKKNSHKPTENKYEEY